MKSIVIAKRHKNEFYMGVQRPLISWYGDLSPKNEEVLKYDYALTDLPGILRTKTKKLEDIVIKETYDFHELLQVGSFIQVDDKEYVITKVKHGADGTMYYYVNIEINDEDSKLEAQEKIQLRAAFLKGLKIELERKEKSKMEFQMSSELSAYNIIPEPVKSQNILLKLLKKRVKR
ncbi:hypothetical protein [Paenibacillus polymyxa]|uniref:hypothetical protein n=1 Tax=Paenibacillus polymyxa TaxID=1406 RepID=UPI002AB3C0FB|nr:hypothetical protein [Paenibacillus polymyxa]MDY8021167.1 hypothetical protein [Paenibacillus polymyxa]